MPSSRPKRQLVRIGLHHEATNILGGLVACTGNKGCKWSSTDTKGQAVALGDYLNKRLSLDHPINIHLTGCPNSCAQHYVGDIGLQGVKVGTASSEGYHVVFGGGTGADAAIGKQVFTGIPFSELPLLLERVLKVYQAKRNPGETLAPSPVATAWSSSGNVLRMSQQNFVPVLPDNAPFTPEQRAYLNGFLAGLFSRAPQPNLGAVAPKSKPLTPLTILFGSQTGNAENLSNASQGGG